MFFRKKREKKSYTKTLFLLLIYLRFKKEVRNSAAREVHFSKKKKF